MMKLKVMDLARKIKQKCVPKTPTLTEIRLEILTNDCLDYIKKNKVQSKIKILWPTLFNQDQTWWAHDGVLISALRLRGAEIIPTICDKLQSDECMIHSGLWQKSFEVDFLARRKALCNQCVHYDMRLWEILKINPIRLSSFITESEKENTWKLVKDIMDGDWEDAIYDEYSLGKEIWKAVVNNHLQGEIKDYWREDAKKMASHHAFNIIVLMLTYKRLFEIMNFDRVVGNGGYYYQWGVVNHLSKKLNIPYYRYYPIGLQPFSWNYALNSSEIVHLTPAWPSWINQPWTQEKKTQVIKDLYIRGLTANLEGNVELKSKITLLSKKLDMDLNKPTLLVLTGVIWDANTNVKSPAFKNMYEWLWDTLDWFAEHLEYQLIIRVHPGENIVPSLAPNERTKFEKELAGRANPPTKNVIIIKPEEKIDTYDIMHLVDAAAVYMSTTGLEFACLGKPLIAIGPVHYAKKGFTQDPKTKKEYFEMLHHSINNKLSSEQALEVQTLAMKYWYLYAFHASSVPGLFETRQQNKLSIKRGIDGFSSHPKLLSAEDLLPGANAQIDYLCDSIMNHLPIMGENRWPPEIEERYCKI
jgi:hypothetical protein